MHTKKYLATTLLTSALVIGLSIGNAHAQEKTLQPQSSWALTKVDRTQQGGKSYCTLSRKYDGDVVLSLARNQTEEYSLAIDFQKPVFQKDKSVKVNLQPGPGQIRAYDLMPTSDKAIVVRLGWDTGFFDTLNQSQNLKAKVGDQDYAFTLSEIAKGQADLQDCMNNIIAASKGGEPAANAATKDVLAADATAASDSFAAQKGGEARMASAIAAPAPAPMDVKVEEAEEQAQKGFAAAKTAEPKAEPAAKQSNFNKPKAAIKDEPVQVAAAAPAAEPVIVSAPAAPVAASAPIPAPATIAVAAPIPAPVTKPAGDSREIQNLKEKVAELSKQNNNLQQSATQTATLEKEAAAAKEQAKILQQQLAAKQKSDADQASKAAQANDTKLKELETQVAQLSSQNAALQKNIATATTTQQQLATVQQQNKTLQEQIKSLQEEAAGMNTKLTPTYVSPEEKSEAEKLRAEVASLKTQNQSLQSQLSAQASAAPKADAAATAAAPAMAKEIEDLKTQNKALQEQLTQAKAGAPAAASATVSSADFRNTQALTDAQAKVKELEVKNAQLQQTIRQSQTRIAETAINTEGASLRKIADLENKLEAAKNDNSNLSKQLDSVRLQQEDKRLNVVAGDWDLEKATKRFNEAEREIRRLGLQLEQERTSCNREKAQIENMLFDPAVTEQKQIEKLTSLETQLKEAQDKLAGRISQTSMTQEPQAPAAGAGDSNMIARLRQENEALQDTNKALRGEADNLRMQVTDLQGQGTTVRADRVASAQLDMQYLKRQMDLKDSQNEALQNRINYLQKENSQMKNRSGGSNNAAAPRAPKAEPESDKITSTISNQRERLARSGDPTAAKLANIYPAAGTPDIEPAPAVKPAPAKNHYDASSIKSLLDQAGLSVNNVKKASGLPDADNFSWIDSGNRNVRGLASVKTIPSEASFEPAVKDYIANQKAMCPGDFASIPSQSITSASKQMALYEIACVSGDTSSSASILFFEDQGRFIAVSNQTSAEDMDFAMDSRDRVANFVRGL